MQRPSGQRLPAQRATLAVLAEDELSAPSPELPVRGVEEGRPRARHRLAAGAKAPAQLAQNRPGARVMYGEAEFHHLVSTNALGFRSPELPPAKPSDRVRVLVLGDSFAYGVGVEDDATFAARLEALDPRLEVQNAGVNGYPPGQELLLLREVGLGVQPDVVLLAFFWNDVTEAARKPIPPFTLENGRLVEPRARRAGDPPPRAWPDHDRPPLFHDSRARRFLKDRAFRARWQLRAALGSYDAGHITFEVASAFLALLPPDEAQELLRRRRTLVRARRAEVLAENELMENQPPNARLAARRLAADHATMLMDAEIVWTDRAIRLLKSLAGPEARPRIRRAVGQ